MSYVTNPETGRRVLLEGKTGQRILKQYGGGCDDKTAGFCQLQRVNGEPKVNKNGQYSCRFHRVVGDPKTTKTEISRGKADNRPYCECVKSKCKGKKTKAALKREADKERLRQEQQAEKEREIARLEMEREIEKEREQEREREREETRRLNREREKRQQRNRKRHERRRKQEERKKQELVEAEKQEKERRHSSAVSGRQKVKRAVHGIGAIADLKRSAENTTERKQLVKDEYETICQPSSVAYQEYQKECQSEAKLRSIRERLVKDHYDDICHPEHSNYPQNKKACQQEKTRRQEVAKSGKEKVRKVAQGIETAAYLGKSAGITRDERRQLVKDSYDIICQPSSFGYQEYQKECQGEQKIRKQKQERHERQQLVDQNPLEYCDETSQNYDYYQVECDKHKLSERGKQKVKKLAKQVGQQARITKRIQDDTKETKRQQTETKQYQENAKNDPELYCDPDDLLFEIYEPYCHEYLTQKAENDPETYCENRKYREKYQKYCQRYLKYSQGQR